MSWNLALFLPRGVRAPFAAAVSGLLGAAAAAPARLPAMLAGEIAQKLFQSVSPFDHVIIINPFAKHTGTYRFSNWPI